MAESLVFNDGETSEFALINEAGGIVLVEHSYPAPTPQPFYASSADTEGERFLGVKYGNRQISLVVECFGASSETVLQNLSAIVAQIGREGGTLTWVTPDGLTRIFDLVTWQGFVPTFDVAFSVAGTARVTIELVAKPFWRGAPVTLSDHTETTSPCIVFTETSVTGDVPALGKLVIDDDSANDQAWVVWGVQQANYSADASAALFFEAEALTAQGGSATAAGATGASGSGSNVMRNTDLTTTPVSILSGQLTGGGAYLSHVGSYRVFARVYCPTGNTGAVEVALEWSEGDFRRATRNATVSYDSTWEGSFRILDLGTVSLSEVDTGTQRWEPRVLATSTVAGDEIDVDWLMFIPADEGAGEVSAVPQTVAAPSTFSARDEFNQTAGNLDTKTLPAGGTWTTSGAATDLATTGSGTVTRSANNGARSAIAGSTTYASIVVQMDMSVSTFTSSPPAHQLFARYVDSSNYLTAVFTWLTATTATLGVSNNVGSLMANESISVAIDTTYRMRLVAMANGQWALYFGVAGGLLPLVGEGSDSTLATGGALASGKVGFMDYGASGTAPTRTYDNFAAWVPAADAAMFASQSLTIHHDKVRREDSGGTLSVKPSSYEGDYLLVPPTGPDARTTRIIVKASRNVPGEGADSGIDDISARLSYTPRGISV